MGANANPTNLIVPAMRGLYDKLACAAYPIVRVTAGLFLVPHGAQKLFGMFGGGGLGGTAGFFAKIGLEPALPLAALVGFVEFFGGICIAIGLLTRPFAAAAAIMLLVGAYKVHLAKGFFMTNGGYEYALMWALLMVAVFIKGGAHASLDRKIGREF